MPIPPYLNPKTILTTCACTYSMCLYCCITPFNFTINVSKNVIMMQVNTEPTISRSIKLIVRPGAEGGMRPPEEVSGNYFHPMHKR